MYLDNKQILLSQRVARNWRQVIHEFPSLRWKLFLTLEPHPLSIKELAWQSLNSLLSAGIREDEFEIRPFKGSLRYSARYRGFVCKIPIIVHEGFARLNLNALAAQKSFMQMLLVRRGCLVVFHIVNSRGIQKVFHARTDASFRDLTVLQLLQRVLQVV